MAKKQKSFADKASGNQNKDSVFVKYVKSTQSEETGGWRFSEQIVQMQKGEQLDIALKRLDEVAKLVDIDLSQFVSPETEDEKALHKEGKTSNSLSQEVEKNVPEGGIMATVDSRSNQEEE